MTHYELLKEIVCNGSNLVLCSGINRDVLHDLAAAARTSGAQLTVTTSMNRELIAELSRTYGSSVTFVDGLRKFEKDE